MAYQTKGTQPVGGGVDAGPMRRIGRILAIGGFLSLTLLSFPSMTPWMIAAWLLVYSVLVMKGRPAWVPLALCLVVLVVRLVPRTPAMLTLGAVLLYLIAVRFHWRYMPARLLSWRPLMLVVPWLVWGAVFWEHEAIEDCGRPTFQGWKDTSVIVCIGDSLTDGMLPDRGYPDALSQMLPNPVINEGVSGIATRQALDMMPRVMKHGPAIVVIEVGGHDFLKGYSRASTKANLVRMIDLSREGGAEVILMEIPRGFMIDPFASLEREIAYEKDVQLVDDTWLRQIVLMSPIAPPGMWMPESSRLSDDGIHSNPKGSREIAERVAEAVGQLVAASAGTDAAGTGR
ncbi:Lysophospholipase L1 [Neorhodopirellula lusitana]|uniref:Lysophospholipase L1 n=1 Tax=Neorhodopirellula lusitana TaxID=445327 RepID=A0ABY1QQR9_9BACT|nr:GDSL-type esterase/lipase family protein [Neorhodopirellula lusitana]SMP76092.1 Lysophospholipase L1 [Neorhodopirellula lusitana]